MPDQKDTGFVKSLDIEKRGKEHHRTLQTCFSSVRGIAPWRNNLNGSDRQLTIVEA